MGFEQELKAWPRIRVEGMISGAAPEDVDAAIAREDRTVSDLAALLSPSARPKLEAMACEAQRLTRWHFGRTIALYAPLYLSNVCAADCVYCGFATQSGNKERRVTLTPAEVRAECEALAKRGFDNVLLLTGDAPRVVSVEDLGEAVAIAREHFSSVSVEVYAMGTKDYAVLHGRGLEGVTLYMETYDRPTYERVHLSGRKRDYDYRLDAVECAGAANLRKLNIGVLLGLFDWRVDGFWMALHARYLQKVCWQSAIAVSFPRLRHVPDRFVVPAPVSDADMVHLMLALRLFLPEVAFVLSTRESPRFRDRLIPLGITMMSAGSSTRPGGYATCGPDTLEQFELDDTRHPSQVVQAIIKAGYDPVWKDFDRAFDDAGPE